MRRFDSWSAAAAVAMVLAVGAAARADIPPFKSPVPPSRAQGVALVVKTEEVREGEASVARLYIPKRMLAKTKNDVGLLEGISPARTAAAGVAMSLAVVGLFFVGRGNRKARTAVVSGIGGLALLATGIVWANAPAPRPPSEPVPPASLPAGLPYSGQVVVEPSDGNVIMLVLPKKSEKGPAAQPKPSNAAPNAPAS